MKVKKPTRTDKIREYLKTLKPSEQSPTAVVQALKKKGVVVTVHHVGMVKLALRKKNIMKRSPNKSGLSGRKKQDSKLFFARDLLKSCKNDLEVALRSVELISKLTNV